MTRPKVQCDICGKFFATCGIEHHKKSHENEEQRQKEREERRLNQKKRGPKIGIIDYEYLQLRDDLFCQHCGKKCKNLNSLKQHEVRCPENANRRAYNHLGEYSTNNLKGQTKETSPVLRKSSETLSKKYESGWVIPTTGRSRPKLIYKFKQHNDAEIQKWIHYLDALDIEIPQYQTTVTSDDYVIVKGQYNYLDDHRNLLYEHVYLMQLVFKSSFESSNIVHHLDENKRNNSITNLILFESVSDHVRFHTSSVSYLIYDEETHKFKCINKS